MCQFDPGAALPVSCPHYRPSSKKLPFASCHLLDDGERGIAQHFPVPRPGRWPGPPCGRPNLQPAYCRTHEESLHPALSGPAIQNKKPPDGGLLFWMAESEGFEPPEDFSSTVFKTAAFDRSASSPEFGCVSSPELISGRQRWRIINVYERESSPICHRI